MRVSWGTGPVADVVVAGLMTAVMLVAAVQSQDQPARRGAVLVVAVVVVGSWTALARRVPRVALVGAAVSLYVAFALDVPAFSPALALGVPLFVTARAGHLWWGVTVVALYGLTSLPYRLLGDEAEPAGPAALNTLFDVTLLVLLVLLGDMLRSRRAVREEAALRLRLTEQEHRQRVIDERLRTARDLHDLLAHTLTVVGIQAGVAAENIDENPDCARRAVELVRAASDEAMVDLRSTIAVLRDSTVGRLGTEPAPGLAQLPGLLDDVRSAGVAASLTVHGSVAPLRPAVELVVYRVVQESLTNVLRHAQASAVTVLLHHGADGVRFEVRDDGQTPGGPTPGGSGLRGMAERVAALGGELSYGPARDGRPGWVVRAWLPVGGAR